MQFYVSASAWFKFILISGCLRSRHSFLFNKICCSRLGFLFNLRGEDVREGSRSVPEVDGAHAVLEGGATGVVVVPLRQEDAAGHAAPLTVGAASPLHLKTQQTPARAHISGAKTIIQLYGN